MSLIFYKAAASLLLLVTSLVAVIYPLKIRALPTHNRTLELADALASGIFLGAALFHMLPDAAAEFSAALPLVQYPLAELCCAIGFLLLLFFERLSGSTLHHGHTALPYVIAIIIIIHSFVEGAALGVNTTLSSTAIIFLAILVHKGSESFMFAMALTRSRMHIKHIIFLIAVFSLMTPFGVLLGTGSSLLFPAETERLITAYFNAFAAGTFLYMSTLHHLNHHQREHHNEGLLEFTALLIGLLLMAALAITG